MNPTEMHEAFIAFLLKESQTVFLIHQEMRRGKKCAAAIDFICGEGSYAKLAEEIYKQCRARKSVGQAA